MLATCTALVLAAAYWRSFYGVDLTDESFYVAVPHRFVLGGRPLIDETNLAQQGAGLLAYPLLAAYEAVAGVGGILLFARNVHFLFVCGVAVSVFLGLRPLLGTSRSILPSLLPVAFVPFNLPDLSYNNLGSGLFVAGCFLGLRSLVGGGRGASAAAGLMHGLAIFVYPSYVVPVLVFATAITLLRMGPLRRILAPYAVAVAVPVVGLAALVASAGVGNVRTIVSNTQKFSGQGGGPGKGLTLVGGLVENVLRAPVGLVAWLLLLTPLLLLPPLDASSLDASLEYVTTYGLLAVPLSLLLGTDGVQRRIFLCVWPAAFVGGFATAWTSNNGVTNFALGFAPAAVVTTVLLMEAFASRARAAGWDRGPSANLAAGGALLVLLGLQFSSVYRDGDIGALTSRVRTGAYAGLYTTPEKRRFIEGISSDLRRFSPPSCRILFYDGFPGGYLISRSRPYTNAVWLLRLHGTKVRDYRRVLLRYYAGEGALPDVVVRMSEIPGLGTAQHVDYQRDDPLDRLVRRSGRYELAARRPDYAIYRRRAARCS